jgi:hypothetical protein
VTVLIHLDQHFIERGPYGSERERTLEIVGGDRNANCLISHTCLGSINSSPGLYYQLSLLHTEPRARAGVEQTATIPLTWPWYSEGEGLSARLADDLLLLGETGDHHQQQGPKAICKGWEKSASDRLCRAETVRRYFYIWVNFWLMHIFYQCLHFNQRILSESALYLISAYCLNQPYI